MPKEVAHILFADDVRAGLIESGAAWLAGLLAGAEPVYHFGSIATDSFYYTLGPGSRAANRWGEMVHGEQGEDTAAPVIEMTRRTRAAGDGAPDFADRVAFAAGFLTHMALDMSLHPFIYAISGQYYDADPGRRRLAMTRHRIIEGWLDHWLAGRRGLDARAHAPIDRLLAHGARNRAALAAWCEGFRHAHGVEIDPWPTLARCYGVHAAMLRVMRSRRAERLGRIANRLARGALDGHAALFYPARDALAPTALLELETFIHPVTGLPQDADLESQWRAARGLATNFLTALDHYLVGGANLDDLTRAIPGYSLSTGLPGTITAQAEYFHPIPLDRLASPGRR